jgi:hypothetical protein
VSGKDLVEARKRLTKAQRAQLMLDQNGRCGCGCGEKLDALREGIIDEHLIPLELTGPNAMHNRQLWRAPCSAEKTKKDRKDIAKVQRLAGETCAGPTRRPLRGGVFPDRNRKFNGSIGLTKRAARRAKTASSDDDDGDSREGGRS